MRRWRCRGRLLRRVPGAEPAHVEAPDGDRPAIGYAYTTADSNGDRNAPVCADADAACPAGCDHAQGFLIGRPMAQNSFESWMNSLIDKESNQAFWTIPDDTQTYSG